MLLMMPPHHHVSSWGCSGTLLSPQAGSGPAPWAEQIWHWTKEDIKLTPHEVDAQGMKWEKSSHNDTAEADSGHFCSSSSASSFYSTSSSSFQSSLYFDSFSSCLIWCVYGQSVLRMVYNGTNCAEMSCMQNLCKAPAMLLPESI